MDRDPRYDEFEKLAKPLIEFLNKEFHPHSYIHIETTHATLSEGTCSFYTEEFIR